MSADTVAVVVPFYQRERGILARALTSAAGQVVQDVQVHVIVVDDGAPIDPAAEIDQVAFPTWMRVTLLRQGNAGPAAARNVGLAHAEALGARYVAFLDSDDEWASSHIATALASLRDGASFHFCDHVRYGPEGQVLEGGFDPEWAAREEAADLRRIVGVENAYSVSAAAAFSGFLKAYLSQTSTVVVDLQHHAGARFDERLRGAGEDHLLWLELARRSSRVSFSDRANVTCGVGVNIYYSAIDWGVPATRERFGYLALLYVQILRSFDLDKVQRGITVGRRHQALAMYGYLILRNLAAGRFPARKLFRQLALAAPACIAILPWLALGLAVLSPEDRVLFASQMK